MPLGLGFGLVPNSYVARLQPWKRNEVIDRASRKRSTRRGNQAKRMDVFHFSPWCAFQFANTKLIMNQQSPFFCSVTSTDSTRVEQQAVFAASSSTNASLSPSGLLESASQGVPVPENKSLSLSSPLKDSNVSSERAQVRQPTTRCRQHYRTRCRKCFPIVQSNHNSMKPSSPNRPPTTPPRQVNVLAEQLLRELGRVATVSHWQSSVGLEQIGRHAFRLGKHLQALLREQPEARMTTIRAYSEVFAQLYRDVPVQGRDRVLFVAACMMQSLHRDAFEWNVLVPDNSSTDTRADRERFVWTDNTLRAVIGAVDAALGESDKSAANADEQVCDTEHYSKHNGDETSSLLSSAMQQQYQLTANALMDWRLRLAPVDEVAQAYRFADPRVLVKIARRWRISTLDVSAVEAAMMLFHACLERKSWRAAVEWLNELSRLALATDSLLAEKRAILLEVLIKQQQWSLAAQCAQDWKDAEHLEELRWLEAQEVLRTPMTRGSKTATGSLVPFQVSERTYTAPECALDLDSMEPSLGEAMLSDSEKGHGISSPTLAMLRLPANVRVHWVATVTAASHLEQFVRAILASETATLSRPRNVNESRCVGLDVEWKPVRTAGLEPRCALLQVAFLKDVFLVDLLRLDLDRLFASQLNEALQLLFRSPDILKVGFGFSADLARLRRSYRYLSCLDVIVSLRDLDRINWEDSGGFCATLAARVGRTNVRRRGRLTVGLAQLVEALLGRWINKCPRCSNWEARPLSPVQIEYAALDAWVLLMLLERMPAAAGRRVGITRRPLHDTNLGTPSSEMTLSMMDHDTSAVVHMAALERVCKALSAHDRWRGRPVYRFNNVLYAGPFCPLVRPTASAATPDLRRVDDAAFALGVADHRIGKCIALVAAEQRPLLVVMAGQRRAPLRRIARMMDLPCSALRFATPLELVTIFGFAPGSVSPLGLLNEYSDGERVGHAPMLTFMDDALRAEETTEPWCQSRNGLVFVSAGSPESMMAISAVDLQYYRRALWLSVLPKTNAFIKRTWDLAGAAARGAQAPWGTRWMRSYFEDCRQGRFVVDSTMGGLVRRLRALGMDVLHTPEKNVELLFGLAWMPEDGAQTLSASKPRVILTRDAEILSRATRYGVPCYYVAATQTGQQAQEVLETFQLFPDSQNFLARCVQCNCARFEQRTRDEVRPYLPSRTVESFQTFYECAQCHQLYWKGAHFERATQQLAEMVHQLRLRSHESRVP